MLGQRRGVLLGDPVGTSLSVLGSHLPKEGSQLRCVVRREGGRVRAPSCDGAHVARRSQGYGHNCCLFNYPHVSVLGQPTGHSLEG